MNEIGRYRRGLLKETLVAVYNMYFGRDLGEHATTGIKHMAPWKTSVFCNRSLYMHV